MHRITKFTLAALLLILFACRQGDAADARLAPAPGASHAPLAQLADVVAKTVAALGGHDKLAALKTVRMTGELSSSREVDHAPLAVDKKGGDRYLRRLTIGHETVLEAVDGDRTWEVDAGAGIAKPQEMDAVHARRYRHRADLAGPLVDAAAKGIRLELAGSEQFDGDDVYRVRVHYPDSDLYAYLISAKTFLPVAQLEIVEAHGKTAEIVTRLKGYRQIDGLAFPFEEETEFPKFKQTIVWKQIQVNVPLDDAEFKMPH